MVAYDYVGPNHYACHAVGWYVVNAKQWTGYFIKTTVSPAADGSFRTATLQMGSVDETTSSWYPFLLGGTQPDAPCSTSYGAQTATGEYHGAWPPAGTTILYSASIAVHRTT